MTPAQIREAYDRLIAEYRDYTRALREDGCTDIPSFDEYTTDPKQAAQDRWYAAEAADELDLY